jgi:uncharacterized protein (TIGR03067 family)
MRYAFWLVACGLLLGADSADRAIKEELERLRGTWKFVAVDQDGTKVPEALFKNARLICKGDHFGYVVGETATAGTFRVDPAKKPKTIDVTFTEGPEKGNTTLGIYELEGDTYRICISLGKDRPTEFISKPNSGHVLEVLKREKSLKER